MAEVESHCPATKAADILGDKWTLLILRALILGARRYSDFVAAMPRISPSVLSSRLKSMVENGLILKRGEAGQQASYRLTPSGREAQQMIVLLSDWGLKWAKRNTRIDMIDVGATMWDFHRTLVTEELPDGENVFAFTMTDLDKHNRWWIIASQKSVDLCDSDPGKPVDLYIHAPFESLIDVWRGECDLKGLLNDEVIVLAGEPSLESSAEDWFPMSPVVRAAKGEA